ncbi:transposase [Streptomyces lavendulae]|uniref:transposase n=2 Tax=Streptomyces lavendulae TaxID=1914 RepID=UPI0036E1EBBE
MREASARTHPSTPHRPPPAPLPTGPCHSKIYRRRNTVERCFNQLKGFRGIATRYEKTAASYEAAVTLASLLLWARSI